MTDLEMTKLCFEAMGGIVNENNVLAKEDSCVVGIPMNQRYRPLHDDAQAMALVKRFRMFVNSAEDAAYWKVAPHNHGVTNCHSDLNRAIVECVAKMQAAKKEV